MFYYLNPGFTKDDGHHMTHQSILHNLYGSDFCVLANTNLSIENLPYKTLNVFQLDTWKYQSNRVGIELFTADFIKLKDILKSGDTIFMYMSDLLFIYPILDSIERHGIKGKFILNLFHTGRKYSDNRNYINEVKSFFYNTADLREKLGISILVEAEQLQSEIKLVANEDLMILPLFHSLDFNNGSLEKKVGDKKVVTLMSASKHKGLKQFVELINFISQKQNNLFNEISFKLRIFQESKENVELVKEIKDKVEVSYGMISESDYQKLVLSTDIMILPYLEKYFFASTSGVFSDSVMNEIPIVATKNTWPGDQLEKYEVGESFVENNIESFYTALLKVINNYPMYKDKLASAKHKWVAYHSPENLKEIFFSISSRNSLNEMVSGEKLLGDAMISNNQLQELHFGKKASSIVLFKNKIKTSLKRVLLKI